MVDSGAMAPNPCGGTAWLCRASVSAGGRPAPFPAARRPPTPLPSPSGGGEPPVPATRRIPRRWALPSPLVGEGEGGGRPPQRFGRRWELAIPPARARLCPCVSAWSVTLSLPCRPKPPPPPSPPHAGEGSRPCLPPGASCGAGRFPPPSWGKERGAPSAAVGRALGGGSWVAVPFPGHKQAKGRGAVTAFGAAATGTQACDRARLLRACLGGGLGYSARQRAPVNAPQSTHPSQRTPAQDPVP
jgi:hypothetical protein